VARSLQPRAAMTPDSTGTGRPTGRARWSGGVRATTPRGLRRVRPSPLLYVLLLVVGAPLAVVVVALAVHVSTTEPRDTRNRVMREAQVGMLAADEQVIAAVPVYQRPAGDYFRATRGVLLLTDRRLVHVGLLPRDIFVTDTEPDAFVRRAFPIDTTAPIAAGRGFLGLDRAIVVDAPTGRVSLSVADEHWEEAQRVLAAVEHRQAGERAIAARRATAELAMADAARLPVHHRVQRGEALSTIARRYGQTVEELRRINGLEGSRIRVGQLLLVKPAG
jgi:LysM repeat protein